MSRYNFFEEVSVASTSYPTNPQCSFGFHSTAIVLLNRGSNVVFYSFDGSTDHGDLDPSDASIGLAFDGRVENKIWFRTETGTSTVRVEAWGASGR